MALLAIEGFDHYQSITDVYNDSKWTDLGAGSRSLATGRFGGQCLALTDNNTTAPFTFGTSPDTLHVGFAYKAVTFGVTQQLVNFREGATTHMSLQLDATGHIRIMFGESTLRTTSTGVLNAGQWHYIEVKCYVDNSAGTVDVIVDEQAFVNQGASDTQNGAVGVIDNVEFSGYDSDCYIDDIYVLDTTGSAPNNTYLGDCVVNALYPSANGQTNDWDASAGSNYQCVDTESTDYVSTSVTAEDDLYAFDDLPTGSDTVFGVQISARAYKDDTGTINLAMRTTDDPTGTPTQQTGTTLGLTTTSQLISEMFETYDGSNAWTQSKVNGAEFGIKSVA